MTRKIKKSQKK